MKNSHEVQSGPVPFSEILAALRVEVQKAHEAHLQNNPEGHAGFDWVQEMLATDMEKLLKEACPLD